MADGHAPERILGGAEIVERPANRFQAQAQESRRGHCPVSGGGLVAMEDRANQELGGTGLYPVARKAGGIDAGSIGVQRQKNLKRRRYDCLCGE